LAPFGHLIVCWQVLGACAEYAFPREDEASHNRFIQIPLIRLQEYRRNKQDMEPKIFSI
jgi:hypothetical protein